MPALTLCPSHGHILMRLFYIPAHQAPSSPPLPGSAVLAEQRPGTVRAGFGAKCIFSLGKQAGAGVLHPAQLLTGNFEAPGSFLPH